MAQWLTPDVAVALMYLGVVPSVANVYLLWEDRHKPGVLWFLLSMATGGAWAFLFATFTLVADPGVTLALANVFWAAIPTAAVCLFLLAYEFVFKRTLPRRTVAALFAPVAVLFALSWVDPGGLVFTTEYGVTPEGFLGFPNLGGPVKVVVTKLYGYLLVLLAAGMFVGEALRARGVHRRQVLYLLVVFTVLVGSTMVKVAGLVPVYFDPTSVVYSLSGVLFAYSIRRDGLMKFVPAAREQTFEEASEAILIVGPDGVVVDTNGSADHLFDERPIGRRLDAVLPEGVDTDRESPGETVTLRVADTPRHFSVRTSTVAYGRGLDGEIVVLRDVTEMKRRQNELTLLKQILSRVFRHDIRNDLNVIVGYADYVRENPDGDVVGYTERIGEAARAVVDQAEKVRTIEEVLGEARLTRQSLRREVREALDEYDPDPTVSVEVDVDDVTVEVHPKFSLAVRELVENAVVHHSGRGGPEVELFTELSEEEVTLVVQDDGPGLPDHEVEVLRTGAETELSHSSGIGLWLVYLITARSNGTLAAETSGEGTRVRISLPRDASGSPSEQERRARPVRG
jgi:signal transduction histidine kinase